jgi:uncharacterized protein (DUF433 family)
MRSAAFFIARNFYWFSYFGAVNTDAIEVHPDVCNGRPVVRGTRIAVESVLGMLAAGDPVDEVLRAYPTLTREQVLACTQ